MKLRLRDRLSAYIASLRFAAAYMGFDPSHQPMFDILMGRDDLTDPTGWVVSMQRSIKMGYGRRRSELIQRARDAGGVAALRVLHEKRLRRSVTFSVYPYASPADAQSSLSSYLGSTTRRPFSKFILLEARIVDQDVPGISEVLAYEERSAGPKGLQGTRLIAGTLGNIVFSVKCYALGEAWAWAWEEVIELGRASEQNQ